MAVAAWHEGTTIAQIETGLTCSIFVRQPWRLMAAATLMSVLTAPIFFLKEDPRALVAVALITVIHVTQSLAGRRIEKIAGEEDLALFDDPSEAHQELIQLTILRNGERLGQDRGIVEVSDGWLSFSGHRTAFNVSRNDLIPVRLNMDQPIAIEAVTEVLIVRLQNPDGITTLRMEKLQRSATEKLSSFREDLRRSEASFARALFDLPNSAPKQPRYSGVPSQAMVPWKPPVAIALITGLLAYLISHDLSVGAWIAAVWGEFTYLILKGQEGRAQKAGRAGIL